MAVYDQWHKDPRPGDEACACGTRARPLYPSSRHKVGDRWQVRWRNLEGKQRNRSFARRVGGNPDEHADAFDAKIARELDTRTYVDPALAEVTFEAYAETWRKGRGHDTERAAWVERMLRNHCYPDRGDPARTPRGGVPVGQHALGLLAARATLTQAWIQAMPLDSGSRAAVVAVASAVYRAAIYDGIIGRNPVEAPSVTRPAPGPVKARPWAPERIAAVRDALPGRYAVIPELGAATGMRQGEMFGLGKDDVQFLGRRPEVRIVRQLKHVGGQLRFGPVKNRKEHSAPLPPSLGLLLARHMELYPPVAVTLPWHDPRDKERHGQPETVRLVLPAPRGGALRKQDFNERVWGPALVAAGAGRSRQNGCHALRHTAASVWLRNHIDIVRVAAWLGDTPHMVTKVYAHLLPDDDDSDGREAMDAFLASCAADVTREGDPASASQAAT